MGQHWFFLTVCGFALAATVGLGIWWVYGRVLLLSAQYRYRYTKLPSFMTSPRRGRSRVPTLLRRVSFKEDEEAGNVTESSYELYSRRD